MQILFGFLLTVVFTGRFESAGALVHGLHLVAVLLAVAANGMALGGLGCLTGAITATLCLIVDVVFGGSWALLVAVLAGSAFVLLWFVMPHRLSARSQASAS